jgi:hypothetical protein
MKPAAVALALALGACGSAPPLRGGDDSATSGQRVVPPAYPRDGDLIEFTVTPGSMRFFVDAPSLSVPGRDAMVRYTLVTRSPEGVRNVSYESLNCAAAQYRVHALGQPDASWGGRESEWRGINDAWHRALYREYFCPQNEVIRSADEGVRALQQGGHPFTRGFGAPGPLNAR